LANKGRLLVGAALDLDREQVGFIEIRSEPDRCGV
jgi:hypothetical protein